jgi:hypothetical protein
MGEAAGAAFLVVLVTMGMTLRRRGLVVPAMVVASTQLSTWSHRACTGPVHSKNKLPRYRHLTRYMIRGTIGMDKQKHAR